MGASKIPLFAYVDESGNTGKNIFDEAQPDYYTTALISKGNFDATYDAKVRQIARTLGSDCIHAGEVGVAGLDRIALDLADLIVRSDCHFFVSRVEKKYLLASKIFDVLFDSGENAAVPWHIYNIRPLRIIMAFKFSTMVNEQIAREFWEILLLPSEEKCRARLPALCDLLLEQIHNVPDERSREIIGESLRWILRHPETIHFETDRKFAQKGHYPNLVAFSNLLRGLEEFSTKRNRKFARITHDEQNEFGQMLQSWHKLYSNAAPDLIEWGGEKYKIQMTPNSEFVIGDDKTSVGIQLADVSLWLFNRYLKRRDLSERCEILLKIMLRTAYYSDFSFQGVHDQMLHQWGPVLFGPVEEDKLEKARELMKIAEERRVQSMRQYEVDGLPPFMRD